MVGLRKDIPKVYSFSWGERVNEWLRWFWFEMDGGDQNCVRDVML